MKQRHRAEQIGSLVLWSAVRWIRENNKNIFCFTKIHLTCWDDAFRNFRDLKKSEGSLFIKQFGSSLMKSLKKPFCRKSTQYVLLNMTFRHFAFYTVHSLHGGFDWCNDCLPNNIQSPKEQTSLFCHSLEFLLLHNTHNTLQAYDS